MAAWEAARRAWLHRAQDASLEQVRPVRPRKGRGSTGAWLWVMALFGGRALQTRRAGGG